MSETSSSCQPSKRDKMKAKTKVLLLSDSSIWSTVLSSVKPLGHMTINEDESSTPTLDLSNLTVSSSATCSLCKVNFLDASEQRDHFKLDWHRFNLSRKLKKNQDVVTEETFAQLVADNNWDDDQDSLSGSDDEDQDEDDLLWRSHPRVFFESDSGGGRQIVSIFRCVLNNEENWQELQQQESWAVLMLGGGHFAGAIFDKSGLPIVHKTFHCYTVRAKQGGGQSAADNKSSHHKSAGASLRRYNEASLSQHVSDIMDAWKSDLEKCTRIFFRAVGSNKKVLFARDIFNKNDSRLRSIPFPTRRATFKEVKRVHEYLSTVEIHTATNLTELKERLLMKKKPTSPSKKAATRRRSKSREEPHRPLPDFVQSLADSESDPNFDPNDVVDPFQVEGSCDLQEYENTARSKKRQKKKIEHDESTALLNSMVTACKTNDLKLMQLCLQATEASSLVNFRFTDQSTLLHMASKTKNGRILTLLLESDADPTLKDKFKKVPYNYCPDKETRNAFRRHQAGNPDKWDYKEACIPTDNLLTPEEEARIAAKKADKRRAQKVVKKQAEKEKRAVEDLKLKEQQEKQRFLKLSDREKRALAAEKRALGMKEDSSVVTTQRCFQCGTDITGKVPFEYSDYRFCKPACVKEHRQKK